MNIVPAPGTPPFDHFPSNTFKYSSSLARSWPRSASPSSLDRGLQMHLQTRSITFSKCFSKLPWIRAPEFNRSRHSRVYPNSLDHSIQVRMIMASNCVSTLALSRPPSYCKYTWWRPPSVSLSSLDRHLQGHLALLATTAWSQSRYTVCLFVIILHSPRRGAQLSYHKPADHWWSWHFN